MLMLSHCLSSPHHVSLQKTNMPAAPSPAPPSLVSVSASSTKPKTKGKKPPPRRRRGDFGSDAERAASGSVSDASVSDWAAEEERAAVSPQAGPARPKLFEGKDAFPPMSGEAETVSFVELNAGQAGTGKGKGTLGEKKERKEVSEEVREKRKAKQKEARQRRKEKIVEEKKQASLQRISQNAEIDALASAAEKAEVEVEPETQGKSADQQPATSAATIRPEPSTSALGPAESSSSQHPFASNDRPFRGRGRGKFNHSAIHPAHADRPTDAAYPPRVGGLWKHDARHYDDGASDENNQAGVRPMGDFWRGRGGPRGIGMAIERMTEMDREELRLVKANEAAQARRVQAVSPAHDAIAARVGKPKENERWGHEGYAELAAGDDMRGLAGRGRGRGRGRGFALRPVHTHLPTPEPSPDRLAPPLPSTEFQPPAPPVTSSAASLNEASASESAADYLFGDNTDVLVRLPGASQPVIATPPPPAAAANPAPDAQPVTAPTQPAQAQAQSAPEPPQATPTTVEPPAASRPTQLPSGMGVTPNGEYYALESGPPGNFRPPVVARPPFFPSRPSGPIPLHAPQAGRAGFGVPIQSPYPPQDFSPRVAPPPVPNGARPPMFQPRPSFQQVYMRPTSPTPFYPVANAVPTYFAPARTSKVSIRAPGAASPAFSGAAGSDGASYHALHAQATGQESIYSHVSHPSAGGTPDLAQHAGAYDPPAQAVPPPQPVNYSFFPDSQTYEPGTVINPQLGGLDTGVPRGAHYYGHQAYWPQQQQGQWYYEEGYGY
ncbi:hypothetical protein Q5752_005356 [Cryptotrichosporon argae]